MESLALVGVAIVGMTGVTTLGRSMTTDIAGDGAGITTAAKPAAMATGRMAASLGDAARVAREAAGVATGGEALLERTRNIVAAAMKHEMTPDEARALRAEGRAIFQRDATRVPEFTEARMTRKLGAANVLSLTDGVIDAVRAGELDPAEAFHALQYESTGWSHHTPDRAKFFGEVEEADPFEANQDPWAERQAHQGQAQGPVVMGQGNIREFMEFLANQQREQHAAYHQLSDRAGHMDLHSPEVPWLLYDTEHFSPEGFRYLDELQKKLAETGVDKQIQEAGLRIGLVDFGQVNPAMSNHYYVTVGMDTVLLNADADFEAGHMTEMLQGLLEQRQQILAQQGHAASTADAAEHTQLSFDELWGDEAGGAGQASEGVNAAELLQQIFPLTEQSVQAWQMSFEPVFRQLQIRPLPDANIAEAVTRFPQAALFQHGDVPRFLEENGHDEVARELRASGKQIRVDGVSFQGLDRVFGDQLPDRLHRFLALEGDHGRLFLNTGDDTASWSDILADFARKLLRDGE